MPQQARPHLMTITWHMQHLPFMQCLSCISSTLHAHMSGLLHCLLHCLLHACSVTCSSGGPTCTLDTSHRSPGITHRLGLTASAGPGGGSTGLWRPATATAAAAHGGHRHQGVWRGGGLHSIRGGTRRSKHHTPLTNAMPNHAAAPHLLSDSAHGPAVHLPIHLPYTCRVMRHTSTSALQL